MTIRKVVKIDEEKCTGCGECVPACAEGAIQIIDGVARLVADNLCDGLGACLGECPEDAITIEEREADEFDEKAAEENIKNVAVASIEHAFGLQPGPPHVHAHGPGAGCPGARVLQFSPAGGAQENTETAPALSELRQWPVQLHLVPPQAPYFKKADVILAADCVAFSMDDFHKNHLRGRALAVACPKLDHGQEIYLHKLIAMIDEAQINTLIVMVMEVPCCAGLVHLAKEAAGRAHRKVPVKKVVVGIRGEVMSEDWL